MHISKAQPACQVKALPPVFMVSIIDLLTPKKLNTQLANDIPEL